MLKKRELVVDLAELNVEAGRESAIYRLYPALWDFLVQTTWPEDGSARKTGSILLFVQDGFVKCRLVDNDQDLVAFWAAPSIAQCLEVVCTALDKGEGDWRTQKPFQSPRKKA